MKILRRVLQNCLVMHEAVDMLHRCISQRGELVSHFRCVKGCRVYMVLNSWSLEKRAWCNHTSFLDMRAQVQKPQRVYVRVCADTYVSHPFAMYGVPLPCWLKLEGA